MSFFRGFIGAPLAGLITIGLFLAMAALISQPDGEYPTPTPSPKFEITMDPPPEGRPKPKDPRETIPDEIPETIIDLPPGGEAPTTVFDPPARDDFDTQVDVKTDFAKPAIRVPPPYPDSCRSRGAEGRVVVQFDVTPEGNVTNIQFLESADRCFERTVRNSVAKWKYPPAIRNGRPAMRYGLVEVFNFDLIE